MTSQPTKTNGTSNPAIPGLNSQNAPKQQVLWADKLGTDVEVKNSIEMNLRVIPPGTFTMGPDNSDRGAREKPAHQVTLSQPFMLGVYEVTQEQYERVMGVNPSEFKGPQNPVEKVSWEDAVEFCQKLSALPEERSAGRVYRLPTEAEWEYACRAGTTTDYSFGDDAVSLDKYAWYGKNSGRETHPVGQKQPNAWGLYDMHGNVFEWCADGYGDYPSDAVTDPTGAKSGSSRVLRGGSWGRAAEVCRSAYRYRLHPSYRFNFYGFRVTCVPSGQ
ncbi:MAG: formylglycine-generating enzyme family protein [Planctomycetota bacterium]|nr:formylglycine-generating enzyme family protein [Planctomycetota bacterium]